MSLMEYVSVLFQHCMQSYLHLSAVFLGLISIVHAGQSQFCQQGFCVLFLYCIHLSAGSFVLYCMQSYLHLSAGIFCHISVLYEELSPFVDRDFCLISVLQAALSSFVYRDFCLISVLQAGVDHIICRGGFSKNVLGSD